MVRLLNYNFNCQHTDCSYTIAKHNFCTQTFLLLLISKSVLLRVLQMVKSTNHVAIQNYCYSSVKYLGGGGGGGGGGGAQDRNLGGLKPPGLQP